MEWLGQMPGLFTLAEFGVYAFSGPWYVPRDHLVKKKNCFVAREKLHLKNIHNVRLGRISDGKARELIKCTH